MDKKIQIFVPEFTSVSVTVKFPFDSPSQSEYKTLTEWRNYFVTLMSTTQGGKKDYGKCLAIFKHASFCEGTYAKIIHETDKTEKYIKMTLDFPTADCLNKFIGEFEEKVNMYILEAGISS